MRLLEDALFVLQDRAKREAGGDAPSLPHASAPWGVPVVYAWSVAIVLSLLIRLVLFENTVATYLLLNSLSFGSVFLVNSFIVARRVGDVTHIRYPMRDPEYADKWRYKLMKRMTGPAALLLLLDLGVILFYGALGHWELTRHRSRYFGAAIIFAAMAVLVNGASIADLVWGLGPDD